MTDPEIYRSLTTILRDVFLDDDLVATPDMTAQDVPGWDSFKQLEIVFAVEENYNIKLDAKESENLKSLSDLAKIISAKTA